MAIGISPDEIREYVLSRERELDESEQTIWLLGPMSLTDEAWYTDQAYAQLNGAGRPIPMGQAMLRLCRACIKGARNFKMPDGRICELDITDGFLTEKAYRTISREDRISITVDIIAHGVVGEEIVEKSESQPTSPSPKPKPAAQRAGKASN